MFDKVLNFLFGKYCYLLVIYLPYWLMYI